MKKLVAATLALALIGSSAGARAETRLVSHGDLNLTTPEGQKQLDTRIRNAARDVCAYNERVAGSFFPTMEAEACVREAVAKARASVAVNAEKQRNG